MRRIFLALIIRFMENNLCREYSRLEDIRECIASDEELLQRYKMELMMWEGR